MVKPKILYLITQSEFGGARRYSFDLANNLQNDYEIMVAAGGQDELFERLKSINVTTFKLKNLVREINLVKDIFAYWEIKKLLQKIKPDILHLNSSKAEIFGALAGHRAKIKKIIYTVHGFVFNEPMPKWKKLIYLWLEKFSAKYKNNLICVSDFDRQTGIKNKIAPSQKFITIYNGVAKINFLEKKEARKELNLPLEKTIIGTIANFYPTKGLIYLIKAAPIIIKKYPDLKFKIIGDGALKNQLTTEIEKLNLKDYFSLEKKENAASLLLAFDIFALPSIKEGLPYTILEAAQAGIPIIATNVGGIPEMIKGGESGLLVNPADSAALAETIIQLLEYKKLAEQFGNQARIGLNQKFNLNKMIAETKKIYDN